MAILKPTLDKPYEVALKYKTGNPVTGKFGPQVLFTLTDGQILYLPVEASESIASLNLSPQEPFILTKQAKGAWSVERKPQPAPGPRLVPKTELMNDLGKVLVNGEGSNALRLALHLVIDEAADAEKYAASLGLAVRFSGEDIRCMVNTMCIGMQQR